MAEFEHRTLSPWGYAYDAEALPDLITPLDFANLTNGKFGTTDTRIAANISSASASIRNFCGWHVSPSLVCGMLYNVYDLRDAFSGRDLLIQLPATFVTGISKVILNAVWDEDNATWLGEVIEDQSRFDNGMGSGLLKVYDVGPLDRRSKIFVKYTAGFPETAIPIIKELTANGVTHALTNTYGVNSEAAGGVSVSYNTSWTGKGSTALANDTREALEPYRVKGVF